VAGERRYRAAVLAGLSEIPVIVRSFSEEKRLEIAIIENVQREDLNPVEEAMGYRALMDLTGVTQEDVASRVGKNRSTVANALRVLKLPEDILDSVKSGQISPGHARALLSAVNPADMRVLFSRIIGDGLSVRETERTVQEFNRGMRSRPAGKPQAKPQAKIPEVEAVERRLIDALGTKVSVSGGGKKGTVVIEYYSGDDLDRICGIISGNGA
jgi:ParB family transcriptional regulator, chromosome partitioning protein